jgi:hypothetical protein
MGVDSGSGFKASTCGSLSHVTTAENWKENIRLEATATVDDESAGVRHRNADVVTSSRGWSGMRRHQMRPSGELRPLERQRRGAAAAAAAAPSGLRPIESRQTGAEQMKKDKDRDAPASSFGRRISGKRRSNDVADDCGEQVRPILTGDKRRRVSNGFVVSANSCTECMCILMCILKLSEAIGHLKRAPKIRYDGSMRSVRGITYT